MVASVHAPTPTPAEIRQAPKALLHDHLDGGLRPATIIELAGDIGHKLPATDPEERKRLQAEIDAAEGRSWPMGRVERFAFYERARQAYAVIQTGERRFYGCFLFKKGVIAPE